MSGKRDWAMEGEPLRVTRRPFVMKSSGVWCFLASGPFRVSLWAQGGVYRIQAAGGAPRGERLPARQSDLSVRQLRATIHDVDIAGVAEHPVAFSGGQLLDDTELLQVAKRLVDRRRGEAELPDQRARSGERVMG